MNAIHTYDNDKLNSPENGCRLYRKRFPFTRNFFGTGGSDERRTVESLLFSLLLMCPLTCFCSASYRKNIIWKRKQQQINMNLIEMMS